MPQLVFLPEYVQEAVRGAEGLYELRLRANAPAVAISSEWRKPLYFRGNPVILTREKLQSCYLRACEYSLHAYAEQIRRGFLTLGGGVRIGLCGECVRDGQGVVTLKSVTSLNIRLPREVRGCADSVLPELTDGKNAVIYSPPACGKTTLLRDICRQFSQKYGKNVSVVDERGELSCADGTHSFLSDCDVQLYCGKKEGLRMAVRTMAPDVLVCDELQSAEECRALLEAATCGIQVIASVHASSREDLLRKESLRPLLDSGAIGCYIELSEERGKGLVRKFLNERFEERYPFS